MSVFLVLVGWVFELFFLVIDCTSPLGVNAVILLSYHPDGFPMLYCVFGLLKSPANAPCYLTSRTRKVVLRKSRLLARFPSSLVTQGQENASEGVETACNRLSLH